MAARLTALGGNGFALLEESDVLRGVVADAVLDRAEDIADVRDHNLAVKVVNQLSKAIKKG